MEAYQVDAVTFAVLCYFKQIQNSEKAGLTG